MQNKKLPKFLKQYFWDVVFEDLNTKKHAFFLIKRVLDRGNLSSIRWIFRTYGREEVKRVVMQTRDLSRPSGNFWAEMLDIPKDRVICLQKPYSPIHFGLSS